MSRDMETIQEFYGSVLGWTFRSGAPEEGFCVAFADGAPVAGIGAVAHTYQMAVSWTPYFAVENADAAAARIRERSATVAVGPINFGKGRAALAADPDGAVFGIWQGQLPHWSVGRGSAPAWLELRTRDTFAAAIFYAGVLNWASEGEGGCDVVYKGDQVIVRAESVEVAGISGGAVEAAPDPHVRPRWHVYFKVADVEEAVRAARAAGGTVTQSPHASRLGKEATLRDPDGGLFTVLAT
ncbi:VOC family protein [Streptomyces sp. XD-27]|uniref:VOC family protein n=1 Tax=Streptomyces sp. XD-27 TaxID=3062779 RepID=UPI0026F4391C|nr:VOC family protein [Streptomyces sp. XD-27]WKX74115.1 VOC family protein [Streptomyces sp. XD-27]